MEVNKSMPGLSYRLPFNLMKRTVRKSDRVQGTERSKCSDMPPVQLGDGRVTASDIMMLNETSDAMIRAALYKAVAPIYAAGCKLECLQVALMLSSDMSEVHIKRLTDKLTELSCEMSIRIIIGSVCYSNELNNKVIISTFAMGNKLADKELIPFAKAADIILTKELCIYGAMELISGENAEVASRLPGHILDKIRAKSGLCNVMNEADIAYKHGIMAAYSLGRGGIEAGLYELSEAFGSGFRVDMSMLRLAQESVEVCEVFRLSPYKLDSSGAMLLITDTAKELIEALEAENISAVRIGTLNRADRGKCIMMGDKIRYLDRP